MEADEVRREGERAVAEGDKKSNDADIAALKEAKKEETKSDSKLSKEIEAKEEKKEEKKDEAVLEELKKEKKEEKKKALARLFVTLVVCCKPTQRASMSSHMSRHAQGTQHILFSLPSITISQLDHSPRSRTIDSVHLIPFYLLSSDMCPHQRHPRHFSN